MGSSCWHMLTGTLKGGEKELAIGQVVWLKLAFTGETIRKLI
jgi:hypothetical protein